MTKSWKKFPVLISLKKFCKTFQCWIYCKKCEKNFQCFSEVNELKFLKKTKFLFQRKSHHNYRDVKFDPPPKKELFGGVCFSRLKSWIFEFGGQKMFWWQKSLNCTFRPIFGRSSAISDHQTNFKILKISEVSVFEGKFCDFFFKNKIFV